MDELSELVSRAATGDRIARERVLHHCRGLVMSVAGKHCGRKLEWGHDEELSIGLLAVNEAIDCYDPARNLSFTSFCKLLIRRRLIDYCRSLKGPATISLDKITAETEYVRLLQAISLANYVREQDAWNLKQEVAIYRQHLARFGLDLDTLVDNTPRRPPTRKRLLKAARAVASDPGSMERLYRTKRLPTTHICSQTGLTPRVVERGRNYIIALAILLASPELPLLRAYILTTEDDAE